MKLMLGLALVSAMAAGHAEERQMSTEGNTTYCLGRYLIDLPAGSRVSARYTFAGSRVDTHAGVSREGFADRLAAREAGLRNAAHRDGDSMYVAREDIATGQVSLVSWASPNSRRLYRYDDFAWFPAGQVLYQFQGEGDATPQARAKATAHGREVLGALRPRARAEVPAGPGFCIDSGVIAHSRLNREEVTATIRLRDYPTVTLDFMSYTTGRPASGLLKRAASVPPGYEDVAARMTNLRRGDRDLGPVQGQEVLVRADADGKTAYQFLWESQGQANSIEHPFLSLELGTTGETDDSGEVIDAPFGSSEDALALWDAILDSLRLRPGAVSPR
ncbi:MULTISPECIES: T6SS immunity protein Tli4 family protein [unclassified Luteimonas]